MGKIIHLVRDVLTCSRSKITRTRPAMTASRPENLVIRVTSMGQICIRGSIPLILIIPTRQCRRKHHLVVRLITKTNESSTTLPDFLTKVVPNRGLNGRLIVWKILPFVALAARRRNLSPQNRWEPFIPICNKSNSEYRQRDRRSLLSTYRHSSRVFSAL